MSSKKAQAPARMIAVNKKARHDYFLEERFEAGLALEGWEVKSLRAGRAQLKEGYVGLKNGEVFLFAAHISPLASASTHVRADPRRTRKLLLHREEIRKLIGAVERRGYTLVPLALYWKQGRAKLEVALARGKRKYDKRATLRAREAEIAEQTSNHTLAGDARAGVRTVPAYPRRRQDKTVSNQIPLRSLRPPR
jgi:SsrA-binding protein